MFHRETDAAKVARNRDAVFDLHATALAWLEDYTGIPYPFGKFDFVAIPSFQFSGMEHPGAILYNAASLLLDESATQNQMLDRASVIAHETSHMWFGDLVTMRWFNDVWMKEVFANFMAAKIVNPSFPQVNHDLRFLLAHYPARIRSIALPGPIRFVRRSRTSTKPGSSTAPIIYQKAPVVMRQLEMIVGERAFRDGLREYLEAYAFGNATWLDLVRILDATNAGEPGGVEPGLGGGARSARVHDRRCGSDRGRISRLTLEMRDPLAARPGVAAASAGRARISGSRAGVAGLRHRRRPRGSAMPSGQPQPLFVLRERRGSWLRAVPARRREQRLPAAAYRGRRRSADTGQRVGDALGEHARVARDARPRFSMPSRARCRARPTNRTSSACSATRRARSGATLSADDRAQRAPRPRVDAACGHRSGRDEQLEGGVVCRASGTSR